MFRDKELLITGVTACLQNALHVMFVYFFKGNSKCYLRMMLLFTSREPLTSRLGQKDNGFFINSYLIRKCFIIRRIHYS